MCFSALDYSGKPVFILLINFVFVLLAGVAGLYRGIASNIASSAPISAVYTFTYESVKGSLLPFLPKVKFFLLCSLQLLGLYLFPYHRDASF